MAVNTVQISARSLPFDPRITANGGYTLPMFAFIPHPVLQQLSSGMVQSPGPALNPGAVFAAPLAMQQRPYSVPAMAPIYGIRSVQVKQSP